jgi:hypothetical protein
MRRIVITFLVALIVLAAALLAGRYPSAPSAESVAQRFNMKKSDYERLRDMLAEDKAISDIAPWGVTTITRPYFAQTPPTAELRLDRYKRYLALMENVGAGRISRRDETGLSICISMWAAGWAADTFHVNVCWSEHGPPANSIGARWSFSPLGDNWFVERDDI